MFRRHVRRGTAVENVGPGHGMPRQVCTACTCHRCCRSETGGWSFASIEPKFAIGEQHRRQRASENWSIQWSLIEPPKHGTDHQMPSPEPGDANCRPSVNLFGVLRLFNVKRYSLARQISALETNLQLA